MDTVRKDENHVTPINCANTQSDLATSDCVEDTTVRRLDLHRVVKTERSRKIWMEQPESARHEQRAVISWISGVSITSRYLVSGCDVSTAATNDE